MTSSTKSWRTHPHSPEIGHVLARLQDIAPGGIEFVFGRGLGAFRLFVLRLGEQEVRAYINRCPHYSLPLNHRPGEFLTHKGDRIMCRQHLALFAKDDGRCLEGACEGEGLTPVPVSVDGGDVVVG